MHRRLAIVCGLAVVGTLTAQERAGAETPDYAKARANRAAGLTTPYGWFSLVALEWLKPGLTTVGSAKDNTVVLAGAPAHLAAFEQRGGKVVVRSASAELRMHDAPVAPGTELGDDERDQAALVAGSLHLWAIARGDKRYLRVKDAEAAALKSFHGLRWYAPDPRYRVQAKWVPYAAPHTMNVMNKLGQITPVQVPGYAEFELDGKKQTLTPMEAGSDGLWFVFRDATYRTTTDGGGRFLTTEAPSHGLHVEGTVALDFNEAVNPPCAYSPYATCPLASPENRLVVEVKAGEQRYEE